MKEKVMSFEVTDLIFFLPDDEAKSVDIFLYN